MDDERPEAGGLLTIGELSRRTGLSVRTIRFYSDAGLVPPSGRTASGYRLYDRDCAARLDLVRTLRDLGVDLATIQRVLARELTVAEVAELHVGALDAQIRTLRLRRAVLQAIVRSPHGTHDWELMSRMATLSDAERHRIIGEFIDATFQDLDANPEFVAMMRSCMPEMPEEPTPAQLDAWTELAELVTDPDFRASIRRMAQLQADDRRAGKSANGNEKQLAERVRDRADAAIAAGTGPADAEAAPVVEELVTLFAAEYGCPPDAEFRTWLLRRMRTGNDPRAERYWHLIGAINGWPQKPPMAPAFRWLTEALAAHAGPDA